MEYKHINDCWEAIRNAKTITDVENLFKEFPRWSGDWDVQIEMDSFFVKQYVVYNTFYDASLDDFDTQCETLEIEVEEEPDFL